jgi:hypothetical protein
MGYRLDPKWIEKRSEVLDRGTVRRMTFRQAFELLGSLIWASYIKDEPLWMHAESLAALQHLASEVNDQWDSECEIPSYASQDIQEWAEMVRKNCWCNSPDPRGEGATRVAPAGWEHASGEAVFSDASDVAGAWVRVIQDVIVAGQQWMRKPPEHIFLGELEAFVHAVRANRDVSLFLVDNLSLKLAVDKGHSSSYQANCRFRESLRNSRPRVEWLSTTLNIADPFSRATKLPKFPSAISDWVEDDELGDTVTRSSHKLVSSPDVLSIVKWRGLKTTV